MPCCEHAARARGGARRAARVRGRLPRLDASANVLSGNWNKANNAILDALKSVTLSDLLNPEDFFSHKNSDTSVLHT